MRQRRTAALLVLPFFVAGIAACGDDAQPGQDAIPTDAGIDAEADAGLTGLSLELGEIADVTADASGEAAITLSTPTGQEEFLLMIQSRARALGNQEPYSLTAWSDALHARRTLAGVSPSPPPSPMGRAEFRCGFDLGVLETLRDRLAGQAPPRGQLPAPLPPGPTPNEGATVTFEISGGSGVETIDASVLHVSSTLVICLDKTTDPSLTLDGSDLQAIADGFAQVVLPRERIFFGHESDVNQDGHITLLFSPLVADTATAYVNPYDLITDPALRPAGVAANDQELIYLTPPQMLDPHMASPRAILETVAHEFQHSIYFYRKYLLNDQLGGQESVYITEGLSGLAQDISGYQAGIFFESKSALDAWDLISFNDLVLSGGGYFMDRSELYGGAYLLMRYLYDQAGGDVIRPDGTVDEVASSGATWLRAFESSPLLGEAAIEDAAGRSSLALATDWLTALMVDDRVDEHGTPLNEDPRYNFLPTTTDPITGRQRGVSMFDSFMGMVQRTGPVVRSLDHADHAIRVGGSEYVQVSAERSGTLSVRVFADPEDVDPFVRVFRVK